MSASATPRIRIGNYVEEMISSYIATIAREIDAHQRNPVKLSEIIIRLNLIYLSELIVQLAAFDDQLAQDPEDIDEDDELTISPYFSDGSYMACRLRVRSDETGPYYRIKMYQEWSNNSYKIVDSKLLVHGAFPKREEKELQERIKDAKEGGGNPVMLHEISEPRLPGLTTPIPNRRVTRISYPDLYGTFVHCEPSTKSWAEILGAINTQIDALLARVNLDQKAVLEQTSKLRRKDRRTQAAIDAVITHLAAA